MQLLTLIACLRKSGVELSLTGSNLLCQFPIGWDKPELKAALIENKEAIKAIFREAKSGQKQIRSLDDHLVNQIHKRETTSKISSSRILSSEEMRLWYLDEIEQVGSTNNMPLQIFRLKGLLNISLLEQAIDCIVRKHESLRTLYRYEQGTPKAVVIPQNLHQLIYINTQYGVSLDSTIQQEQCRHFNLESGPLFQFSLVEKEQTNSVLIISIHHIISDGWSVNILVSELASIYSDLVKGVEYNDCPLSAQYQDYAQAQSDWLASPDGKTKLEFWQHQLSDAPQEMQLPMDFADTQNAQHQGMTVKGVVSSDELHQLRKFCKQNKLTVFVAMLGAFKLLLSKLNGSDDFLIGCANGSRHATHLDSMIGCFVNHLVIRNQLKPNMGIVEYFNELKSATYDAFEHQQVPYECLQDIVAKQGNTSRKLFNVYFNYLNYPVASPHLQGLEVEELNFEQQESKFDVTLYVKENDDHMAISFNYNGGKFKEERIEHLFQQYLSVLNQLINSSHSQLSEIHLPPFSVNDQMSECVHLPQTDIITQLTASFEENKSKIAITDGLHQLTYNQLSNAVDNFAEKLISCSVERNSVVAVLATREIDLIPVLIATLKIGAVFTILPTTLPEKTLIQQLKLAAASNIVHFGSDKQAIAILDACHVKPTPVAYELNTKPLKETRDWPQIQLDDTAYIGFTSGTSGKQKAVVGGHASLAKMLPLQQRYFELSDNEVGAMLSGLAHDPLHRDIFLPLLSGGTVCIAPSAPYDSLGLQAWLNENQITLVNMTPSLATLLTQEKSSVLPSIKTILLAGEAVTKNIISALQTLAPNAELFNLYGCTETQQALAALKIPKYNMITKDYAAIGNALGGLDIGVLNQHGHACGLGEIGYIWVDSLSIAKGYLNHTGDSGFSVSKDGTRRYNTGDLGRINLDGTIEYRGRADRQIKIRGYRVEPAAIEAIVLATPGIESCRVLHKRIEDNNQLVAFVKYSEPLVEQQVTEQKKSLRQVLIAELPDYCVPNSLVVVDEWPLTSNGKLDQRSLLKLEHSELLKNEYQAPSNDIEQALQAIWMSLLQFDSLLSVESDFFEIGGHSLMAVRLVAEIHAHFEVDVSVADIFAHSSIRTLAMMIENASPVEVVKAIQQTDRNRPLPLSFSQKRLWFIDQLNGNTPEYNIAFSFKISGGFDVVLAERTLTRIVERHEILRTHYDVVDGEPKQFVDQSSALKVTQFDFSKKDKDSPIDLTAHLNQLELKPFDLSQDLMLRTTYTLLAEKSGQQEGVFTIVMHHIATDGWSMALLWSEFRAIYSQLCEGKVHEIAYLDYQYGDFAEWQQQLPEAILKNEFEYWEAKLSDISLMHSLPLDNDRPERKGYNARKVEFKLTKEVSEKLEKFARTHQVTPFMLSHAVLALVLSRHSNQQNVVIGTPVANRTNKGMENLIGLFVNTLVLNVDTNHQKISDFLAHVKQINIEAQSNQNVPFDLLVERLAVPRSTAHNPIVQIVFSMNTIDLEELVLPGTKIQPMVTNTGLVQFDLDIKAWMQDGQWAFSWSFDTSLFKPSRIETISRHFETGLTNISLVASDLVRDINILSQHELNTLVVKPTEARVEMPVTRTPIAQFEAQVRRNPHAIALHSLDTLITYEELNLKATRLAKYLHSIKVSSGDYVGLHVHRSVDSIVSILAILKLGAAYVPLDPQAPIDRQTYQIHDCQLSCLLVKGQQTLSFEYPHELKVVTLSSTLLSELDAGVFDGINLTFCPTPDNIAYVIYTSGSTGQPKGVSQTNYNLMRLFSVTESEFNFNDKDVWLLFHSLAFDFSIWEMWGALIYGGALVIPNIDELRDPALLSDLCQRHKVSVLNQTPSAFHNFSHYVLQTDVIFPQLRYIIFGGEALKTESITNWWNRFGEELPCIVNMYGITEITVHGTIKKLTQQDLGNDSVGLALKDLSIYLLDPQLAPVPHGAIGEMCIAGAGLTSRYLGLPKITAEKFVTNPYSQNDERLYLSGDLARQLPNGEFQYVGRKDNQIKLRGFRIELMEIEKKLLEIDGVIDVYVAPVKTGHVIENIVAYIVTARDMQQDSWIAQIRSILAKRLPTYMIPTFLIMLDSLPKTINGKVATHKLPPATPTISDESLRLAQTQAELMVEEACRRVLDTELKSICLNRTFFEIGGHSLLAIKLISILQELSGIQLSIVDIFDNPKLCDIAKCIETEQTMEEIHTKLVQAKVKSEGVL